jgi:hypothetical protein
METRGGTNCPGRGSFDRGDLKGVAGATGSAMSRKRFSTVSGSNVQSRSQETSLMRPSIDVSSRGERY